MVSSWSWSLFYFNFGFEGLISRHKNDCFLRVNLRIDCYSGLDSLFLYILVVIGQIIPFLMAGSIQLGFSNCFKSIPGSPQSRETSALPVFQLISAKSSNFPSNICLDEHSPWIQTECLSFKGSSSVTWTAVSKRIPVLQPNQGINMVFLCFFLSTVFCLLI